METIKRMEFLNQKAMSEELSDEELKEWAELFKEFGIYEFMLSYVKLIERGLETEMYRKNLKKCSSL
jgi:uncharacterized protein YnzC (UPF0291/DUF896 family)